MEIIIIILFLVTIIGAFELWVFYQIYLAPFKVIDRVKADTIVICGCKPFTSAIADRISSTKKILKSNPDAMLIITGTKSEVRYIKQEIIHNNRIIDDGAQNTFDNIKNTHQLYKGNTVIISNKYHLFRIKFICQFLLVEAEYYACDQRLYLKEIVREFFACQKNFYKLIIIFFKL